MPGSILTIMFIGAVIAFVVVAAARDHRLRMATSYPADMRLFRSNWTKAALVGAGFLYVSVPAGFSWIGHGSVHLPNKLIPGLPMSDFWLSVMCFAGIYSLGALGLTLLIGFTGQVSIGQSFFVGLGAYSVGYFGKDWTPFGDRPLPFLVWFLIAGLLGAVFSAMVGPFALRLRGHYLAVVSIGLVITFEWLANFPFESITKGTGGRNDLPAATLTIWPGKTIYFSVPEAEKGAGDLFGYTWSKEATHFWLIWAVVIIGLIIAKNVTRSRQGRAMMAIRDRDLSAEAIGVSQAYTKVWAFALAGGFAACAGALYASYYSYAKPDTFGGPSGLAFSIQFVVMIIIGGSGSLAGPVLGGVAVAALDFVIERFHWLVDWLPFVQSNPAARGLTVPRFIKVLQGLIIIIFLMFAPLGINGLWQRIKKYFSTWPFST